MSRKILVRVSTTGGIEIEADGFQGKGCTEATQALEEALGQRKSRDLKPGFHRQDIRAAVNQTLGDGGGER